MEANSWALTIGDGELSGDLDQSSFRGQRWASVTSSEKWDHSPAYLRGLQCRPHEIMGKL